MSTLPFPASVYAARLDRAATLAAEAGLEAIIVGPGPDLQYLVGVEGDTIERLTALVISTDGTATVIVPRMELAKVRTTAVGELGLAVADWVDGEDPYALVTVAVGTASRVGVSDALPALHVIPIGERLGVRLELATPVLREGRMIKDAEEITELRRAGDAIDAVHRRVHEWLRAGRTEREVAADIADAIVTEGHRTVEFVIVGSGPNGADPHHEVSDRVIEEGDVVVVDIGGAVPSGYNSDSTRTYVVGTPDPAAAERIAVLVRAQQAAVDAVRPGVTAAEVDAAARTVLADAGLGEAFLHRTGHGIGVSVHEEPYIAPGNDLVLRESMAFSIEPGIYFAGSWGARIEDIVIVTADGGERLNVAPHELTSVGGR
ncbi:MULTISPECIES: Xaa-Pro peptidase family protein [unclassified Microbacterium]|uniref:M24 family metallopeptidase n=1 Tax=unclassified Microbacterium TaxID=2609290 RepID=UPI000CFD4EFA|nr:MULTISPECIES: Xaa-Pro peptidase family protein [unclassified Microbacterium]PQZ58029.1 peptidase M24 family protein [Microbacterium sp. MYb43]PQZ80756.1 peptidase M24 family protein [Microbacterium sp. MYb40]PRB20316.1 peptidase M24 family protein [Microbacterium sp. MYb54]PRB31987.1 peptidase M24 family protein [Microbacterium sp. MYb50]PRB66423.1 peptidase M24 family protein [Microbacterium sp. MYb24]